MKRIVFFYLLFFTQTLVSMGRTQNEEDPAEKHFILGVKLFDENKFAQALEEFKTAYALKHEIKYLYNMAASNAELGDHLNTATQYSQVLDDGKGQLSETQVADAMEMLFEAKKHIGILTLVGKLGSMTLLIDDVKQKDAKPDKENYLSPGEHRVIIKDGTGILLDQRLDFQPGVSREIATPAPRKAEPIVKPEIKDVGTKIVADKKDKHQRMPVMKQAAYGTLAATLATLVVGAALGGIFIQEKAAMDDIVDEFVSHGTESERDYYQKQLDDHYNAAKAYGDSSGAMFIVSGALALSAITLFVLSSKAEKKSSPSGKTRFGIKGPNPLQLQVFF